MNMQKYDAFVDEAEASVTTSMHESSTQELRRGRRVENNQVVVERWIHNKDRCTRTPSLRVEYQDEQFE